VGCGCLFETMIFRAEKSFDDCGCYRPGDWTELEMIPANDSIQAQENHEKAVDEYMSKKDNQ